MNAPPPRRRLLESDPPRQGGLVGFASDHRAGLLAIALVAAAAGGGWIAWNRYGQEVQADRGNLLFPDDVELSGVGDWIRCDLKAEALRDASLENGLPLDDPELARRLARAFDIHPWVREVVRVSLRHPAGATVEVRCREPVAMVSVPGGLLAVDAEGIVLPSDDFVPRPQAANRYPRLTGITSGPRGAFGFSWGDPLVEEGAAVAAMISPEWGRLELLDCRPVARAGGGTDWELVGEEGLVIAFGSAPGHEQAGEPAAAIKVARLRELAAGPRPSGRIDLTAEPAATRPLIPPP
jgi:hypothetical protein